jgi:hypothetical protein
MSLASTNSPYAEGLLRTIHEGLKKPGLYETLRRIYVPVVDAANMSLGLNTEHGFQMDERLAAVYIPIADQTLDRFCCNDASVDIENCTAFAIDADQRQRFIRQVRRTGQNASYPDIESGRNYCLSRILASDGKIRLELGYVNYGRIMRTSDCLIEEIGLFFGLLGDLKVAHRAVLWMLPWRKRVTRKEGAKLFASPSARAAGLGVAAATCYRSADSHKYEFVVGLRSNAVATYTDAYHVAPAGMCNTKTLPYFSHYFLYAITSEFLEEIFDQERFEKLDGQLWKQELQKESKTLFESMFPGRDGDIVLTGLAFDLLNLRPEICILIVFHTDLFHQRHIKQQATGQNRNKVLFAPVQQRVRRGSDFSFVGRQFAGNSVERGLHFQNRRW